MWTDLCCPAQVSGLKNSARLVLKSCLLPPTGGCWLLEGSVLAPKRVCVGLLARLQPWATCLEDKAQAHAPLKTYFTFCPACTTPFSPWVSLHLLHCIAVRGSQGGWHALNTDTEAEQQAIGDGDSDKVAFTLCSNFFIGLHGLQEVFFVVVQSYFNRPLISQGCGQLCLSHIYTMHMGKDKCCILCFFSHCCPQVSILLGREFCPT